MISRRGGAPRDRAAASSISRDRVRVEAPPLAAPPPVRREALDAGGVARSSHQGLLGPREHLPLLPRAVRSRWGP